MLQTFNQILNWLKIGNYRVILAKPQTDECVTENTHTQIEIVTIILLPTLVFDFYCYLRPIN